MTHRRPEPTARHWRRSQAGTELRLLPRPVGSLRMGLSAEALMAVRSVFVSRDGAVRWRRDLTAVGFARNPMVTTAAGDSDFYFLGKRGADQGIWAWPFRTGEARPDPPGRRPRDWTFSVIREPVGQPWSDGDDRREDGSGIWVTDLH